MLTDSTHTETHTATHTITLSCTHTGTRAYAVCVYPWHAKSAQLMNSSVLIITHTPHCAKDVEQSQPSAARVEPTTNSPPDSHTQLKQPPTARPSHASSPPPPLYTPTLRRKLCQAFSSLALSSFLLVMLPVLPFRGCQKTFIQFCTEIHTHTHTHMETLLHTHTHTQRIKV